MTAHPIVEFLVTRLRRVRDAATAMEKYYPSPWDTLDRGWYAKVQAEGPVWPIIIDIEAGKGHIPVDAYLGQVIEHVALHDPETVIAACDLDLAIVHTLAETADFAWINSRQRNWPANPNQSAARALMLMANRYPTESGFRQNWWCMNRETAVTRWPSG